MAFYMCRLGWVEWTNRRIHLVSTKVCFARQAVELTGANFSLLGHSIPINGLHAATHFIERL